MYQRYKKYLKGPTMTNYLSVKLRVISFFSLIMVVYLHSYNLVKNTNTGNTEIYKSFNSFFQDFFSQGITGIAVPLYFSISGYLFFKNINGPLNEFITKFKKRLKTLVLPYLFWSVLGLLFFFILQNIPQLKTYCTTVLIRDYTFRHLLFIILINPIPYQLWFIRDLIVLISLTPIVYLLIKYFNYFTLLFFLFTWFYEFNFILFSNEAIFFFVFGAFLCLKKDNLIQIKFSIKSCIYTYIWIAIVFCKTSLVYMKFHNLLVLNILNKTSILIGVLALWSLYDILLKNKNLSNHKFYSLISFSFFIYAFHEPILNILKTVLFLILGKDEFVSFLVYIIAPLIVISIGVFLGFYLKRITPKFYGIITGGR